MEPGNSLDNLEIKEGPIRKEQAKILGENKMAGVKEGQDLKNMEKIEVKVNEKEQMEDGINKNPTDKKNKDKKPGKGFDWLRNKKVLIGVGVLGVLIIGAVGAILVFGQPKKPEQKQEQPIEKEPEIVKYYDDLTGEEVADGSGLNKPVFCVQIPNDPGGARPQAGLNNAKIVFEAIAERGITRFAAIFQEPKISAIGPVRSLRIYYFNWDGPFNCTIVHAGGADDALVALRNSGEPDMNESYRYFWRGSAREGRGWNNLFTSPILMKEFNATVKKNRSEVKSFARMLPEEAKKHLEEAKKEATKEEEPKPLVKKITFEFGRMPTYNPVYSYDETTNSYLRAYADGTKHVSHECPEGLNKPATKSQCGVEKQLSPKVVIAMMVDQKLASDGYHEDIKAIGTGEAHIFQNGTVTHGSWAKTARKEQIIFRDNNGKEIKLVPGQVFISALPKGVGGVKF